MLKSLIFASISAISMGVIVIFAIVQTERPLTLADLERVQVGMSHAEVEKLLRRPGVPIELSKDEKTPRLFVWIAEEEVVFALNVSLDERGRVTEAVCLPGFRRGPRPLGMFERFRLWIGF